MSRFSGLMVATLTPFDGAGRLDYGVVRAHTEYLISGGAAGLCPVGTTGEMLYLSVGEKVRLIEETVRAAKDRVPIIAGVSALTGKEIALLARAAEAAGADAVFLPPPIYFPASQDSIFAYYAAVRQACGLPVFAYNIPAYAANGIELDTVERLVSSGVIDGIKDSTGKDVQMRALLERFGARIAVEAASDSFALEARNLGAHGFISALANIWPRAMSRLWTGDDSVQPAMDAVRTAVKRAGGIPALKYLAGLRGFPFGASRLPHSELDDARRAALTGAFRTAGETLSA